MHGISSQPFIQANCATDKPDKKQMMVIKNVKVKL